MQDNNPFSIAGKRVLVTGGSMGIGMGIVKRFLNSGARVMIADKASKPALKFIESLPEDDRINISFMEVDLLDEGAPRRMINEIVKKFGGIDVLVNNAGIFPAVPMLEIKTETFERVCRLNLQALAFTSSEAAKEMIRQGVRGRIINIASIDSFHPSAVGLAAYDASKGGVLMFTKNFALETAPHGITVNAIAPGGIATEGATPATAKEMDPEFMKKMLDRFVKLIPLGRMGVPDDIAKVAVFLASSASDYMTGETVVVDGGRLLM